MKFDKRLLICSYFKYNYIKSKYGETRDICAEPHCPEDRFYYWNIKGQMRHVINLTEIYESEVDEDGWPTMYLKRIR